LAEADEFVPPASSIDAANFVRILPGMLSCAVRRQALGDLPDLAEHRP